MSEVQNTRTLSERLADDLADKQIAFSREEESLKKQIEALRDAFDNRTADLTEEIGNKEFAIRARQSFLRATPSALAAEVAIIVRRTEAEDNENGVEVTTGTDNVQRGWFQNSWGMVLGKDLTKNGVIKSHDTNLDQSDYYSVPVSCPTTGCVAGWVGSLAGLHMAVPVSIPELVNPNETFVVHEFVGLDGYLVNIGNAARDLLGISQEQQAWLFNGERTKEGVLWALDQMASGDFGWDVPEDSWCMTEKGRKDNGYDQEVDEDDIEARTDALSLSALDALTDDEMVCECGDPSCSN